MGTIMDCDAVIESLAWYLNRSLSPEERDAMGNHLARCPACREELAATLEVARLHATHPATETLVALAFGELSPPERRPVESHLGRCESCRSELELAAASASLGVVTEESKITPFPEPSSARRANAARWAAAAAAVAAAILGAWTFFAWQERHEVERWARERGRLEERLGELEARRDLEEARTREAERELGELRELLPDPESAPPEPDAEAARIAALEGRIHEILAPRAGHPVLDLLPEGSVLRSGDPGGAPVSQVPRDSPWVTVFLVAPALPSDGLYRIELRHDGASLWRSEPIAPDELGGFSLLLPSSRLTPPGQTLVVLPEGAGPGSEPAATYRLD